MSTNARKTFDGASGTCRNASGFRVGAPFVPLMVVAALAWAGAAGAQLPLNAAGSPFDIVGFIEAATLDSPGTVLAGGTLQVNGHTIVVPKNTILQMPAAALTWQQLFALAPPPYTGIQTGLAATDTPAPLTSYEAHVQGNRIGDTYIAGLIFISQNLLNAGQGYINFIDYANGELRVGGAIGDPGTGTRVRINDPMGRFAPAYTLDTRFTIDEDNPTVRTETGYPMCFPHQNPAVADDPLCPQQNRPIDPATGSPKTIFIMPDPGAKPGPAVGPNSWVAAPFEVGDFITYAGTRMKDGGEPSAGPLPANGMAGTYIAAHTIITNIGLFTAPGSIPVYVATDVMILGVGGLPIAGLPQEATVRTRFEGFTTDVSRLISLWGIDVDSCKAGTSDRSWGMINVDPGPPTGAVKGRWRFRPPGKIVLMPPSGSFLPATRMMRSVAEGAYIAAAPVVSNNGLVTGQYNAPIFDFLFPENLGIGSPPVPLNFTEFAFLVNGTFAALGNVNAGQLNPFPAATVPSSICGPPPAPAAPTANAGTSQTTTEGVTVTLDGSASTDPNGLAIAWTWTQTGGPLAPLQPNFFVARPTIKAPTIPPPGTSVVLTYQLIVTNTDGIVSLPSFVTITVTPALGVRPPIASAGVAQIVGAGSTVQLNGTASSDPNVPAQPLTFAWSQTTGTGVTLSSASAAAPTFKAPAPYPLAMTLVFSLTVTNSVGSSTSTVNVTVNPVTAPIANAGAGRAVGPNTPVTLDGHLSSDPSGLPLTYQWTQVGGTALPVGALAGATTVNPAFTSPATTPQLLTFQLIVRNAFLPSPPAVVQISVQDVDTLVITVVEYRFGKQRLTVSATSSVTNGSPALSLMNIGPNGANLPMSFLGGGLYTIVLTGVAQPVSVTVTSSLGGTKTSPVLTIRN